MKSFQAVLQNFDECFLFVFGKESSLDRGVEHSLFQLLFYFMAVSDSLTILLRGHYDRCRELSGSRRYCVDV